jgi:dipeptidyl aminopeptidase/acylaminoacyl peptidase
MRSPLLVSAALLAMTCGPSTSPPVFTPAGDRVPVLPPAPDEPPAVEPPVPSDPPVTDGYTGLGADSVTPEVIAEFAAPPLDRAVSSRIEAMLDIRGASAGALTRKGDRMVFTWKVTGTNQVWRQDGAMSFPVQLTGGEDRSSVAGLAPDDSFVVISRDTGGEENPGLYLMDLDGGAPVLIHRAPKVQTLLAYVSDDSKTVWYLANDRDPASYALYKWDVATRTATAVFTEPGIWRVADHQGDEKMLLGKLVGNTSVEIYELDVATGALTPIIGQGEGEDHQAAYGARPGQILIRTNKLGDFQRLYQLVGGALEPITPELTHDVTAFGIDRARTRIYYGVNEDGYARAHAIDARTFKALALPKLPAADNVKVSGVSLDGRYVQLTYDGATQPGATVVYDWKKKKLTTWRVPSTPEIDVRAFTRATLESYPARDGTKIPMFVWRPDPSRCAGPCPVVVKFHGGPEVQSTAGFSVQAQMYVDAGFVFVLPNVRGSDGYGKTWLHADDGPKRLDVITDIEDCAKHIRATWGKDGVAPKIGVAGRSYGGYSVLMAMTHFAGAYDAGVSEVGISNLSTFLANTAPYRRILRIAEYGDPDKDKDALVQLSPTTHVDKLVAPLLIIQGVNDPRVPVGEALQIHRAARARGVPGGLILFPDEGHGTSKRENQVLAMGHTLAFFETHLR